MLSTLRRVCSIIYEVLMEPVLYDSVQARLSSEDLTVAMQNMGYMNATVDVEKKVKGKKLTLNYLFTRATLILLIDLTMR